MHVMNATEHGVKEFPYPYVCVCVHVHIYILYHMHTEHDLHEYVCICIHTQKHEHTLDVHTQAAACLLQLGTQDLDSIVYCMDSDIAEYAMHIYIYIYIYTYTHTYTYIHAHIYTHTLETHIGHTYTEHTHTDTKASACLQHIGTQSIYSLFSEIATSEVVHPIHARGHT
jgi:hypothetical protein